MKDNCVSCNEETQYNITDSVFVRNYYIEGAGQLCKSCFERIYN